MIHRVSLEGLSCRKRVQALLHLPFRQYQDRERSVGTARIDLFYLASPVLAFRLLPYGLSVTSRSIRQSLANSALNPTRGALNVIYAQPDAIAIASLCIADRRPSCRA